MRHITQYCLYTALAIGIFFGNVFYARAATLSLIPATAQINTGATATIDVFVSTPDKAANAFSGRVEYPSDKLEVVSVSKKDSIINFWTVEPTKEVGDVKYEGIVLNPGYQGTGGKLFSITFRAKGNGSAPLIFKAASVLANDGLATNILTATDSGQITIGGTAPVATTPVESTAIVPDAPEITSPTHPDPASWYANSTPQIEWTIPTDATNTAVLINQLPSSVPKVSFKKVVTSYTNPKALTDGVWYAHVRVANNAGFGSVAHFRIGIDTKPPTNFTITPVVAADGVDHPYKQFSFEATDELSGIASYIVSLDGVQLGQWFDDGTHIYTTPHVAPGTHTLIVKAVDGAGNMLASSIDFTSTALEKPTIDAYSKQLRKGDFMIVSGHAYPNATVKLSITHTGSQNDFVRIAGTKPDSNGPTQGTVIADKNGAFTYVYPDRVANGLYTINAVAVSDTGAESAPSDTVSIIVAPGKLEAVVMTIVHYIVLLFPVIIGLSLLIALILFVRHRYRLYKMKLRTEIETAQFVADQNLDALDSDVRNELELLKKLQQGEPLLAKDELFLAQLEQKIVSAKGSIDTELKKMDTDFGK